MNAVFAAVAPPGWGSKNLPTALAPIGAFVLALPFGTAAVAALALGVNRVLPTPPAWLAAGLMLITALIAVRLIPVVLDGSRWRVPQSFPVGSRTLYAAWFGLALGTGVLTRLSSPAYYAVLFWVCVTPAGATAWPVLLLFAAGRAVAFVLVAAPILRQRTDPQFALVDSAAALVRRLAVLEGVLLALAGVTLLFPAG
jgi:hypothetical protein